ncbi:MAG: MFS transporter [Dehalococcoidia bacterium]|jgi:MFS family permease|nr:MFS transporter [Dehalococcoidia bacterium]
MTIIPKPKPEVRAVRLPGGVHYGWVIVAILSVVQIVSQSVGMAAGVMVPPLNDPDGGFGWSIGAIGAGLATYYLTGAIFSPICGWLADRYGAHKMMVAAAVLFTVSMVLLGHIVALWQFFLVFGVMLALTQTLAMIPLIEALNGWFHRRLGLGVGILWAAGGLGSAAIAPTVGYLLESIGWQATFSTIGITGGGAIFLVAPFFRNRPAQLGIKPYGAVDDAPPEAGWTKAMQRLRLKVFNRRIRQTKEFWNLPLIHSLGCAGHGIILIYSIPLAVEQGISLTGAALIISIINIFSIASRFVTPMMTERFGGKPAMAAALGVQGLTVLVLFWANDPWVFYVFAVLFGIGYGGEMSAYPVVNRQYFGFGPLGTFYGIEITGALLGHAVATILAGFVIFVTGSFTAILILSMSFSFVGVLIILSLATSTRLLIPDWEEALPVEARSTPASARAEARRAALQELNPGVD